MKDIYQKICAIFRNLKRLPEPEKVYLVASRLGEGILPLCSAETTLGVPRPALEPSAKQRQGSVGAGPEEATEMVRGMENLC